MLWERSRAGKSSQPGRLPAASCSPRSLPCNASSHNRLLAEHLLVHPVLEWQFQCQGGPLAHTGAWVSLDGFPHPLTLELPF